MVNLADAILATVEQADIVYQEFFVDNFPLLDAHEVLNLLTVVVKDEIMPPLHHSEVSVGHEELGKIGDNIHRAGFARRILADNEINWPK